jgi:protein-tyrosine phosphatase
MAAAVLARMASGRELADGSLLADRLALSSAGTGGWHAGEPMDPRAAAVLAGRGYQAGGHRARPFATVSFADTDLLVCMDRGHQQTLMSLAHATAGDDRYEDRLVMLRQFDRRAGGDLDVPDPYYGDESDFASCLDLVESGCRGLADHLADRLG